METNCSVKACNKKIGSIASPVTWLVLEEGTTYWICPECAKVMQAKFDSLFNSFPVEDSDMPSNPLPNFAFVSPGVYDETIGQINFPTDAEQTILGPSNDELEESMTDLL